MKKAFAPILIIATGIGWMLSANHIMPGVDWAIVMLIGVAGILILVNRLTRVSVVAGPILLVCSVVMVLLQTKKIEIEMGLPIVVITFGVLMLIARFANLPNGMLEVDDNDKKDKPTDS